MFRILVVEDDKDLNRTVCSYLNQNGFEAKGALEAEEAYDMMYETMFDLIISDIMMPGTDGFEFAENVRDMNKMFHMSLRLLWQQCKTTARYCKLVS